METRVDGSPSPPVLYPSSPVSNFSRNTSSSDDFCISRSGSVSSGVPVASREDPMNGEAISQNGLAEDIKNRITWRDGFYDPQIHLTHSQLEVQQEFQKLQIQQLQQKLHQHQLQLQQTQKLLQQHKHMEIDEVQSNSKHTNDLEEMNDSDMDGGMFQTRYLMPLIENRENLTEYRDGHVAANHINGVNSDDFETKTIGCYLPRCYSVGSSGLSHLHKRPSDVFKRRENLLANHKHVGNVDSDAHPSHLKASPENLKRHYRSENGGSFSAPSSTPKAIDLTCKRKRSLDSKMGLDDDHSPLSHRAATRDQHSILKSVLTSSSHSIEVGGRLRSHTLSVCSLQGLRRSGASSAHAFSDSRRVTLAKKNLAPVQRFVIDQLKEIVKFAYRQPDFVQLPMEDKKALLVQAGPRLLLLYMAELNFKFAVTLLWEPVERNSDSSEKLSTEEKSPTPCKDTAPTQRFIETIQNFIGKCQSQSITTDEYFYMRLIVLFHIG